MVGTYNSGLAGSWKRLGPFTKTISDGNIQVRFQSNDVALISGLEIWSGGGTPPATPPSTDTFYRAVNLGGPAMTMDGHNWEANNEITPNFTFNYSIAVCREEILVAFQVSSSILRSIRRNMRRCCGRIVGITTCNSP